MKSRPIIFSPAMVSAIIDGQKTQTRRVVQPQFKYLLEPGDQREYGSQWAIYVDEDGDWSCTTWRGCPYGKPGDILWVREKWVMCSHCRTINYAATTNLTQTCKYCGNDFGKWRPSIHMPKRYSRLDLKIMALDVQRLQSISADEILAEGIGHRGWDSADVLFAKWIELWDSINAKRGFGWEADPWVWVIGFAVKEQSDGQSRPAKNCDRG